ncbi:hypothetical protein MAFF211271_34570 (plasmid) [Ralstonia syzygii subsp. indonesiensis]|nr:hypothetical protein MAFF211271_34570 [Ralstonia pseudosolanacearum]
MLIQIGARVMVLDGQVRSGRAIGGNGRYLVAGVFNMVRVSYAIGIGCMQRGRRACAASGVAGNGLRGRPDSHGRVVWQPVGSRSDSGVRIGADMEGSRTARGLRHTRPIAATGRSNTGTKGKGGFTRLHA